MPEAFQNEAAFEAAVVQKLLGSYGWEEVLERPTPEQLVANWAKILFENNRGRDQLNDVPLSETEMQQILDQVAALATPVALNGFINGGSIAIRRDNPADSLHLGHEVSLAIYNRLEIAAGKSRYQIAQQPIFPTLSALNSDRRGDLLLLINGMPVIHIELKRSGVPVQQAYYQIEKYMGEGVYSGILSLVQVFVCMTPDETIYFANPGPKGRFLPAFAFHWGYADNEPVQRWSEVLESLLSIPMAHQLIGFYTVADRTDGVLKVMRSYQYYAASRISDAVARADWGGHQQRGGYVWHTTGSGKTMTSFKSAQLIAASHDADKVVFLMDRIELGTQSLLEYQNFADDNESVQGTESAQVLLAKLVSDEPDDTLIVTSIQKMSRIEATEANAADIEAIRAKRVVFIIDEAHRSTFGDMLVHIKATLPDAIFFGFTGTPIQTANAKKDTTTAEIFGNELHRYSLADGIRDKNVLGFDPTQVMVWPDHKLREAVALARAHASSLAEARGDEKKLAIYNHYMDKKAVRMAGYIDEAGEYQKGIEDYIPRSQYDSDEYRRAVVSDIGERFEELTHSTPVQFHALLATSSIAEAVAYYRLIKEMLPELAVTALFDPNIDNNEGALTKEEALTEIVQDYDERYGQNYKVQTFAAMKRDISDRLAHKGNYIGLNQPGREKERLDLLIVVDQMLTGFDSKWVNTLFLDKVLRYEQLIQAFSRTNRVLDSDLKPFGIIRYYRQPHTMKRNIEQAVELYAGNGPRGLFVQRLPERIRAMNHAYTEIRDIFANAGIADFASLPSDKADVRRFVQQFNHLSENLTAARLQGFTWDRLVYDSEPDEEPQWHEELAFDEHIYRVLLTRYQELSSGGGSGGDTEAPFDIHPYITEQENEAIDQDYMEANFKRYKTAMLAGDADIISQARDMLHRQFAALPRDRQRYANILLHDMEMGEVDLAQVQSFTDLITERMDDAEQQERKRICVALGLDEVKFMALMDAHPNIDNLDDFNRFTELKATADMKKARPFLEKYYGETLPSFKAKSRLDKYLRAYILGEDMPASTDGIMAAEAGTSYQRKK